MFLDLCGAKLHFEQYGEGKPDVLLYENDLPDNYQE